MRAIRSTAAIVLLLATPPIAHAAPASETAALKRFEEGKKAFEAAQFESALVAFQESLALLPSPNTRLYIGRCYRALGKPASAYTSFRLATREANDRLNATNEKRYKATRETASAEAAEIEAKVPRLTLAVPSDVPADLVVKVDDAEVPKAALGAAVETDPGAHKIEASGSRRKPFSTQIDLKEGEQKKVDVDVPKLPTGTLALVFKNRPGGMEVDVDGAPIDASTWDKPRDLDAGEHKVVVRAPGYVDFTWDKPIADGERADVEVTLVQQEITAVGGGTPKWAFFGVAGLAIVTGAVGTVFAVQAKAKHDDELRNDPLERDQTVQDKIRSQSTQANVLFIASGVLAAGAGILVFTTHWHDTKQESPPPSARISPWIAPTSGGIAASGTF